MTNQFIGILLPSQRVTLAKLYRDIAAAYRAGIPSAMLEGYATQADMMAESFEKERDAPMSLNGSLL